MRPVIRVEPDGRQILTCNDRWLTYILPDGSGIVSIDKRAAVRLMPEESTQRTGDETGMTVLEIVQSDAEEIILEGDEMRAFLRMGKDDELADEPLLRRLIGRKVKSPGAVGWALQRSWYCDPEWLSKVYQR
jgi:hypothetical protein